MLGVFRDHPGVLIRYRAETLVEIHFSPSYNRDQEHLFDAIDSFLFAATASPIIYVIVLLFTAQSSPLALQTPNTPHNEPYASSIYAKSRVRTPVTRREQALRSTAAE